MAAAAATAAGVDVGVDVAPSAEGSAEGAAVGVAQSSAAVGFSGLWPSAVAVRACWASPRMPAKASFGGGAPRAASGAGDASGARGPWPALGELSPLVMSHRSVGEGAGRADRGGRRGARLAAVLVRVLLDAPDVRLRLRVGRDAAVALHGARPRVVGRERFVHVAAEGVELLLEVARAGIDVLRRVVHVRAAERRGGAGHQLTETLRARRAAGVRVEVRLSLDQAAQQRRVEAVLGRGRVDLGLVRAGAAASGMSAFDGPGPPLPPLACAAPAPALAPIPGPDAEACINCCWKFEF